MKIKTLISGSTEEVYVEFPYSTDIKSSYSQRTVNPDTQLSAKLNNGYSTETVSSIGKTALYIYIGSIGITVLSSFGGNSMEMMWTLTNTLQLLSYITVINVHFPSAIDSFASYLKASNAENPYFKYVTFLMIPSYKFTRGDVNNKIGPKAFWVSSADKLPWLFPILFLFFIMKLIDLVIDKETKS